MNDFQINSKQKSQFEKYFLFLTEENKKINLTAIIEREEVFIKHFYDSLKLGEVIDFLKVKKLLDIGSGAGFPGIPIKIMYPELELYIIEPTLKRVRFLTDLVRMLELKGVQIISGRAEDLIVNFREAFPIVTARAVASLPVLLELCLPYVEVGGYFLAMKGSTYQAEVLKSIRALKLLDSEIIEECLYQLPENQGNRVILKIRKNKRTKEVYPRKYAAIKKRHL
mgnify:CR=1 FL=1